MAIPRISIIIPTLNQGRYIEAAILSVLEQNYPDLQLIVIDGGSTDNTGEIISKYKKEIGYFVSEKDRGQSHAINKGLKIANGNIITWLNSDDYYEPGAFDTVLPYFTNETTGIVYGKAKIFGDKRKTEVVGTERDLNIHQYLSYMRIPQPAMFFKSKAIRATGLLNEELHYAMDFELTAKVVLAGHRIQRIDNILANYRFHEFSKSNLNHRFLKEWTQEVHDIFCAVPGGHYLAVEMELLFNLSPKPLSHYKCEIQLTRNQLTELFLEHMDLHFHYAYRENNKNEMERVAGYLRKKYPDAFAQNKYARYLRRINFFPSFMFDLIRKFTR